MGALTTQFAIPQPVRYYRSYYNRLRRIGDLNPCWKEMSSWGSLKAPKAPKGEASKIRNHAESLFEQKNSTLSYKEQLFYDVDGDGQVSREEFVGTYVAWATTEEAVKKEKPVRMPKPDMSLDFATGGSATEEL